MEQVARQVQWKYSKLPLHKWNETLWETTIGRNRMHGAFMFLWMQQTQKSLADLRFSKRKFNAKKNEYRQFMHIHVR